MYLNAVTILEDHPDGTADIGHFTKLVPTAFPVEILNTCGWTAARRLRRTTLY